MNSPSPEKKPPIYGALSRKQENIGKTYLYSVGINQFQHEKIADLQCAVNDAIQLVLAFQKTFPDNRSSKYLDSPTKNTLDEDLKKFLKTVNSEDRVFVYMASHGSFQNNKAYLYCQDSNPEDLENTAIDMLKVAQAFNNCPANLVLFIIDACSAEGVLESVNLDKPLQNIVFLTASRVKEIAWEEQKEKRSFLMKAIRKHFGYFPGQEEIKLGVAIAKVSEEVDSIISLKHGVQQEPVYKLKLGNTTMPALQFEMTAEDQTRFDYYRHIPVDPSYTTRNYLEARIREALVDYQSTTTLLGIKGMGGVGKTALARKICHDEALRARFSNGIIWLSIGREANTLDKLRELCTKVFNIPIHKQAPTTHDYLLALKNFLEHKKCLFIIDDVWEKSVLENFQFLGSDCRMLVTTRDQSVLNENGQLIKIDKMEKGEALELLDCLLKEKEASIELSQAEQKQVIKKMGYLPLAIHLAAGLLSSTQNLEEWMSKPFSYKELDDQLDPFNDDDMEKSLESRMNLSFNHLKKDIKVLYLALSIFPEDEAIPLVAVQKLWSQVSSSYDFKTEDNPKRGKALTQKLLEHLDHRSLLEFDEKSQTYRIHDVLLDFIRGKSRENKKQQSYQRNFLEGLTLEEGFADDGYLYNHLMYHLVESGQRQRAIDLLQKQTWISARWQQSNYTYDGYLSDVEFLLGPKTWRIVSDVNKETISNQLLYHLLHSKVSTLVSKILPEVAVRALELDMWNIKRFLSFTQKIKDPEKKVKLYKSLAQAKNINWADVDEEKTKEEVFTEILAMTDEHFIELLESVFLLDAKNCEQRIIERVANISEDEVYLRAWALFAKEKIGTTSEYKKCFKRLINAGYDILYPDTYNDHINIFWLGLFMTCYWTEECKYLVQKFCEVYKEFLHGHGSLNDEILELVYSIYENNLDKHSAKPEKRKPSIMSFSKEVIHFLKKQEWWFKRGILEVGKLQGCHEQITLIEFFRDSPLIKYPFSYEDISAKTINNMNFNETVFLPNGTVRSNPAILKTTLYSSKFSPEDISNFLKLSWQEITKRSSTLQICIFSSIAPRLNSSHYNQFFSQLQQLDQDEDKVFVLQRLDIKNNKTLQRKLLIQINNLIDESDKLVLLSTHINHFDQEFHPQLLIILLSGVTLPKGYKKQNVIRELIPILNKTNLKLAFSIITELESSPLRFELLRDITPFIYPLLDQSEQRTLINKAMAFKGYIGARTFLGKQAQYNSVENTEHLITSLSQENKSKSLALLLFRQQEYILDSEAKKYLENFRNKEIQFENSYLQSLFLKALVPHLSEEDLDCLWGYCLHEWVDFDALKVLYEILCFSQKEVPLEDVLILLRNHPSIGQTPELLEKLFSRASINKKEEEDKIIETILSTYSSVSEKNKVFAVLFHHLQFSSPGFIFQKIRDNTITSEIRTESYDFAKLFLETLEINKDNLNKTKKSYSFENMIKNQAFTTAQENYIYVHALDFLDLKILGEHRTFRALKQFSFQTNSQRKSKAYKKFFSDLENENLKSFAANYLNHLQINPKEKMRLLQIELQILIEVLREKDMLDTYIPDFLEVFRKPNKNAETIAVMQSFIEQLDPDKNRDTINTMFYMAVGLKEKEFSSKLLACLIIKLSDEQKKQIFYLFLSLNLIHKLVILKALAPFLQPSELEKIFEQTEYEGEIYTMSVFTEIAHVCSKKQLEICYTFTKNFFLDSEAKDMSQHKNSALLLEKMTKNPEYRNLNNEYQITVVDIVLNKLSSWGEETKGKIIQNLLPSLRPLQLVQVAEKLYYPLEAGDPVDLKMITFKDLPKETIRELIYEYFLYLQQRKMSAEEKQSRLLWFLSRKDIFDETVVDKSLLENMVSSLLAIHGELEWTV